MKQDRNGVRTAQDLERKYNLSSISLIKKAVKQTETGLTKINTELENFVNVTTSSIDNLQEQIDGNITTYYYSGVPTLFNLPTSEWERDKYNIHLGDLYYDKDTGYAYRFYLDSQTNLYGWTKLTDSDVTKALAIANSAQDTADSKRRVFISEPYPPYEVGDIWIKDDKDLYRCRAKRESGNFDSIDWIVATDYTNDGYAKNVEAVLDQFKTEVTTNYVTKVLLETTSNSIIGEVNSTISNVETKVETSIKEIIPYYAVSTSNIIAPTDGWLATVPERGSNEYLWRKDKITYQSGNLEYTVPYMATGDRGNDGVNGKDGQPGEKGDKGDKGDTGSTGTGVQSITTEFYLSTSKETQVDGTWVTEMPIWENGKYLWTRNKIVYKNPTSTVYTEPVCDSSYDAVNDAVEEFDSKFEITSRQISAVVSDVSNQESRITNMEETANGLSISVSNQKTQFDTLKDKVEENETSVNSSINDLNNKVVNLEGNLQDMSFNFNTKGLAIATSTDPNSALLDNTGIKVYNYEKLNAIFNNKGSGVDKLIVTGTAQIGYFRTIKSTKTYDLDGTTVTKKVNKHFFLKELIEDLEDLEV